MFGTQGKLINKIVDEMKRANVNLLACSIISFIGTKNCSLDLLNTVRVFTYVSGDVIWVLIFVRPGYVKIVPREGMPISKQQNERGNLVISFNIEFPEHLSPDQKSLIMQALS